MMLVPTYVAPSAIEGVGVFAAAPIPAETVIWRLEPSLDRLLSREAIAGLPPPVQDFAERYGYPAPGDSATLILELDNGRFMNHSLAPNTRFDTPDAGFARRDIAAGEELTCNYAEFIADFEIPGEWAA